MRRTRGLLAAALFLGQAALAWAQTPDTFFGPRQYDHPQGGASSAVDTVTVPDGVVGPFTLAVRNGDTDERSRVEAAWIFLNDVQVAGPEDFHPRTREFGRTVQLQPQNRLVVIIRGRPRTFLRLSLAGTLSAPTVVSLAPANTTVTLGATAKLALTITPAQPADTVVPLESGPAGIVTVPTSVTVPAGQTKVDVPVGTIAFGQAGVTARLNGSQASALVTVIPQSLRVVSIVPAAAKMNVRATSTFAVNINAVQDGPKDIALSVDVPDILEPLAVSVTVPAGATSATFTATGRRVGDVVITASANGTQATASAHVSPEAAVIESLLPSPLPLQQGATGNLVVKINVAQETDIVIAVDTDSPLVVNVPATVTIPAGSDAASIAVFAANTGNANLTVSMSGSSALARVEVSPPPPVVTGLAPASLTLAKGTGGTLTVSVSRAPSLPVAVTLVSSVPEVASVPQIVNIPAGTTSADFPVASNGVGQTTINATLNGGSASATVTITPPELAALTVLPQNVTVPAGAGQTVLFHATGTMTDGTTQDFTTLATWSSDFPAVATIDASGVATTVGSGSTAITASYTYPPVSGAVPSLTVTSSATLTVEQAVVVPPPAALTLTGPATIPTGLTSIVTVLSSVPAPAGGITVALTVTGTGLVNVPPSVLIPAPASATGIPVTPLAAGPVTITASAPGFLSFSFTFTVVPGVAITSIAPTSGSTGTVVTISGGPFDAVPANNTVRFPPGVIAPLISATPTQLVVSVPAGAISGPILVSTPRGSAQSAPFAVLVPVAPTHAHITDRAARPSSPVAPFVLDASPGDTFTFQVLGQGLNGTANVVDNKLVYTPNGVTGPDQFPYRVVKADGSTLDGTARVRVYPATGANSLVTCTRQSVINAGALNRTNATPCSFYAEVVTRLTPTGAATVKYLVARPSGGASPKAAVFLIGGADLDMSITGDPLTGVVTNAGGNFLVRTMQIFADAGYLAIAMNKPSDLAPTANVTLYRVSVNHAVDILAILREENTDDLPLFIAGTSNGAMSVVASNLIATGISISSPVTVAATPGTIVVGDPRFANLQPSFVRRPTHVLWNTSDLCPFTPPAGSQALFDSLVAAGVTAASDAVTGGFVFDNGTGIDQCGGLSFHQFLGIEQTQANGQTGAAVKLTAWLDSRVAALGADRHPDAAFATFSTAGGVALAIDLAPLTSDVDGDPRSFLISHLVTSLGGSVARSGSTVTYTPPPGVTSGTDYFVYTVSDGRGGVGAAVITVKIGG
jgi:hypothetical protein